MKSSKNKKSVVDEISRETQRIVSTSHVCLPYHKPKQKSLKDFLNRPKISKEFQASITGSKKLLYKAWQFIESKEQTVERFYSEDCSENEELFTNNDNTKDNQNTSLNNDDDNNSDQELFTKKKQNVTLSEMSEDEDNDENNSVLENELSINSIMSTFNDDEEENSRQASSINSEEFPTHNVLTKNDNEKLDTNLDSESEDANSYNNTDDEESEKCMTKQFIDDEAELSNLDYSSDEEENLQEFLDDSDNEIKEFVKKKKRLLNVLSDSDDDDDNTNNDNNDSNRETDLTSNDLNLMLNGTETENISTQQLMGLCSGEFLTQESDTQEIEELDDGFDSEVPLNDIDLNKSDDFVMPKLTSVRDFFEDEAELSESDWSSDDEEHMVDTIDKLEEEEGDKDKLDEEVVKDGLDKIYMRQLLDDDQQQVTALKEMLLEDGDLHSDSGRKRKFQWDEYDENDVALKKPLFSDNEDDENDITDEDEKAEIWRKERFKRESYLSQNNISDEDEINEGEESIKILQSSDSFVKKTHIVKYKKCVTKHLSSTSNFETNDEPTQNTNDKDNTNMTSVIVTTSSNTTEINNIGVEDLKQTNLVSLKCNTFIKGSFMKRCGNSKITNKLLYINKNTNTNNNKNKYEEKKEIKSLTTITAKASTNPFAYLLRDNQKQEIKNNDNLIEKVEKNTKTYLKTTKQPHKIKIVKPVNSILKQFD